jgi:hypothetical protein
MYAAFQPMRKSLLGNRNLEAMQIIKLLKEIRWSRYGSAYTPPRSG